MDRKRDRINIFISSPYDEFQKARDMIQTSLRELPVSVPVSILEMPSISMEAGQIIEDSINKQIDQADIVLMLIGDRYSNWVQSEYVRARALNKPIFLFVQAPMKKKNYEVSNFLHSVPFPWNSFRSDQELTNLVHSFILKYITDNYLRFGVRPSDLRESISKEELKREMEKSRQDSRLCFVIMPIHKLDSEKYQYFKAIYDNIIVPAIEIDKNGNSTGLKCERADQAHNTGSITKDIVEKLNSAEVVVADLTGVNPNVFYELGVRHTIRQKTIMVTQSLKDLPFDIANYRTITYNPTVGLAKKAIEELRYVVQALINNDDVKDSPVRDWIPIQ